MAAPLYEAQTREVQLDAVPEPARAAILAHADKSALLLREVRVWVTHRQNPPASSFWGRVLGRRSNPLDPEPHHDMVLVLHPTHVIVATHGPSRGTSVLSLPLMQATITRGSALPASFGGGLDLPSDDGVTVSGFPSTNGSPGTYFVGLGPGADAESCVRALTDAVVRVKNV